MKDRFRDCQYVDAKTGEVQVGMPVMYLPKSSPYKKGEWSMISHQGLMDLVLNYKLTGSSLKVLLWCIANMDYRNRIFMCKASIAKDMGISATAFSNYFKPLVDQNILFKVDKVANSYIYMLNPKFAWKGSAKDLNKAMCMDEEDFQNVA